MSPSIRPVLLSPDIEVLGLSLKSFVRATAVAPHVVRQLGRKKPGMPILSAQTSTRVIKISGLVALKPRRASFQAPAASRWVCRKCGEPAAMDNLTSAIK
jgi:hypothetical protein